MLPGQAGTHHARRGVCVAAGQGGGYPPRPSPRCKRSRSDGRSTDYIPGVLSPEDHHGQSAAGDVQGPAGPVLNDDGHRVGRGYVSRD